MLRAWTVRVKRVEKWKETDLECECVERESLSKLADADDERERALIVLVRQLAFGQGQFGGRRGVEPEAEGGVGCMYEEDEGRDRIRDGLGIRQRRQRCEQRSSSRHPGELRWEEREK